MAAITVRRNLVAAAPSQAAGAAALAKRLATG